MESMGGKELNAGTSYDCTVFHNFCPPFQINKWLEISSQRFLNPTLRTVHKELETVYEEYNLYQGMPSSVQGEFVYSEAFEGHPYSRPIIGLPEHLENPRLSDTHTSLCQLFWIENGSNVRKLLLIGNEPLSIREHFSGFSDIKELKKRLRANSHIELFDDNFTRYSQRFRQLFGVNSEKAIELFLSNSFYEIGK